MPYFGLLKIGFLRIKTIKKLEVQYGKAGKQFAGYFS